MSATGPVETEIKLAVPDVESAIRRIESLGFVRHKPRVFEANSVFDTPAGDLRSAGQLLRLRLAGDRVVLTWKGPEISGGVHKSRPETEVDVSSFDQCELLLRSLGYQLVFRYDKYRTEYSDPANGGIATVDDTPIGAFAELEGEASWIDATATAMGFTPADYITKSYGRLYQEYCGKHLITPGFMLFSATGENLTQEK